MAGPGGLDVVGLQRAPADRARRPRRPPVRPGRCGYPRPCRPARPAGAGRRRAPRPPPLRPLPARRAGWRTPRRSGCSTWRCSRRSRQVLCRKSGTIPAQNLAIQRQFRPASPAERVRRRAPLPGRHLGGNGVVAVGDGLPGFVPVCGPRRPPGRAARACSASARSASAAAIRSAARASTSARAASSGVGDGGGGLAGGVDGLLGHGGQGLRLVEGGHQAVDAEDPAEVVAQVEASGFGEHGAAVQHGQAGEEGRLGAVLLGQQRFERLGRLRFAVDDDGGRRGGPGLGRIRPGDGEQPAARQLDLDGGRSGAGAGDAGRSLPGRGNEAEEGEAGAFDDRRLPDPVGGHHEGGAGWRSSSRCSYARQFCSVSRRITGPSSGSPVLAGPVLRAAPSRLRGPITSTGDVEPGLVERLFDQSGDLRLVALHPLVAGPLAFGLEALGRVVDRCGRRRPTRRPPALSGRAPDPRRRCGPGGRTG